MVWDIRQKTMVDWPKISIITPSFNQGEYLEETIRSVIDQRYPNLEYIVIDGGSSDQSVDIIKKYEKWLYYWISEPDTGQSEAINKGLKVATGDILAWLNSDDLYFPSVLSKVIKSFEKGVGLVYGRNMAFGEGRPSRLSKYESEAIATHLGRVSISQPSAFFSKRVIDDHGLLDESLHYGMDYDLFVRIHLNYNTRAIDTPISKYRFHSKSKTVANYAHFAPDWAIVFSRFLRSVKGGDEYIDYLKYLELYDNSEATYISDKSITSEDIREAVIIFLKEQAECYYVGGKPEKVRKITAFVKNNFADSFLKLKFDRLYYRSTSYLYHPIRSIKKMQWLFSFR